jgi:esterase/lipase superfamily enzyme
MIAASAQQTMYPSSGRSSAHQSPALAPVLILLGLALAGCASRPTEAVLTPTNLTASVGQNVDILVATTRKRSDTLAGAFTSERAAALDYAQYAISIPPTHKAGEIEYPDTNRNPATSLVVTKARTLNTSGFKAAIAKRRQSDVLVFVHGYNTNYPESVFRFAQLVHDASAPARGPSRTDVLFAWPSRGELTGYLADRESVTISRNHLEATLNEIAATPGVRNIDLVAHSMGNWLAVETLRQSKLRSGSAFLAKLRDVMLIAPDIDGDVFVTQLDTIGRLRQPITVVVNKHDLALAASQYLSGDVARVGNVLLEKEKSQAVISKYNLRVIDLSDVEGGDSLKHGTFIKALPALSKVIQSHALSGSPRTSGMHVLAADAAGQLLTAPLRIGQSLIGR